MRRKTKLPELLAPAGSFEALVAAVEAGADAVYFGGGGFHARAMAKNFDHDEIKRAILYLHLHGVKAYITLNTLLFDREYKDALAEARFYYESGADALICADMGLICLLRKELPQMPVHVSTQAFVHSTEGAELYAGMGAERVVLARELSKENIQSVIDHSGAEVEIFLHGAICVCHSGQCLFSSAVGGRSGNRGQCAQPCRLPYGENHWLSIMDMSLSSHIPWLIQSGVASLKIEGRMKSPQYVYHTTKLFRTLLDECRCATPKEIEHLKRIFCRGDGFSDHYFASRPLVGMTGVRSEQQKAQSREDADQTFTPKKTEIEAKVEILANTPSKITFKLGDKEVTARGAIPSAAQNAPLSAESVKSRVAKLGDYFFTLPESQITLLLDEGLFMPAGQINELKRQGADLLEACFVKPMEYNSDKQPAFQTAEAWPHTEGHTASFYDASVLPRVRAVAQGAFSVIYIPLEQWQPNMGANGVIVPPAVFDDQWAEVKEMLSRAKKDGAVFALVSSAAQIAVVKALGFVVMGDLRLSITSGETKRRYREMGVADGILSPELTLPQARDVGGRVVLYGRLPLMLLERCVMREKDGCENCGKYPLVDRTGARFPILRSYPHRNILLNAHPTYMGDKVEQLKCAGLSTYHFIFTTESPKEVIEVLNYVADRKALPGKIKRFPSEKV